MNNQHKFYLSMTSLIGCILFFLLFTSNIKSCTISNVKERNETYRKISELIIQSKNPHEYNDLVENLCNSSNETPDRSFCVTIQNIIKEQMKFKKRE